MGRWPGSTKLLVGVATLVAVLRGLYWVAVLAVPNQIDEAAHLGYVQSLAEGDGIPTVGRDLLSDELLFLVKDSPTHYWRSVPVEPSARDGQWGTTAHQYEGGQGPIYYALMAGPFRLGSAWSTTGAVYAVRVVTVLVAAAAVPLTALLARRLFPWWPAVWWMAALTVAVVNGFNANNAAATNDALAVPLGAGVLALSLDAVRSRRPWAVAAAGFVFGLAVLNKATAVVLTPAVVLAASSLLRRSRGGWRGVLLDAARFGVAAAVPLAAWAMWNLLTYGASAPSRELEELLGGPTIGRDLGGVVDIVQQLRHSFWDVQPYNDIATGYRRWWELAAVGAVTAALGVLLARRRNRLARRVALMAAPLPLGVLMFVAFMFVVFRGASATPGRYLYPLLPLVACLVAGCLVIVFRRGAAVALLAVIAIGFAAEIPLTHRYVRAAYEADLVVAGAAPVVDQGWADGLAAADGVGVDVDCDVVAVAVGLEDAPPSLAVQGAASDVTEATHWYDRLGLSYYLLAAPVPGPVRIALPAGVDVAVSDTERSAPARLLGGIGDPVVRAYCPSDDSGADRFEQLYPPYHPSFLSRGILYAWPRAWFILAAVTLVGVAGAGAASTVGRRCGT